MICTLFRRYTSLHKTYTCAECQKSILHLDYSNVTDVIIIRENVGHRSSRERVYDTRLGSVLAGHGREYKCVSQEYIFYVNILKYARMVNAHECEYVTCARVWRMAMSAYRRAGFPTVPCRFYAPGPRRLHGETKQPARSPARPPASQSASPPTAPPPTPPPLPPLLPLPPPPSDLKCRRFSSTPSSR